MFFDVQALDVQGVDEGLEGGGDLTPVCKGGFIGN